LDTGTDAVYFNNPDLPDTHSEIALPLKIGAEIIGALDVQSTDANAFSDDDAKVLTALANQVSIAIQNSRLYDETRKAVAETEALYSEFIREGWRQFSEAKRITGIRRKSGKTMILTETAETHPASKQTITETSDATSLKLPIKLRAETIGMLNIKAPETREWTQDEIDIINAIIERAAISLENARLLEDAQRRAKKERIIGEITTKISSSINMRNVLQTAVEELGRAIPGSDVIIQFQPDTENGKG
jgi:GAF domain-containing protein